MVWNYLDWADQVDSHWWCYRWSTLWACDNSWRKHCYSCWLRWHRKWYQYCNCLCAHAFLNCLNRKRPSLLRMSIHSPICFALELPFMVVFLSLALNLISLKMIVLQAVPTIILFLTITLFLEVYGLIRQSWLPVIVPKVNNLAKVWQ